MMFMQAKKLLKEENLAEISEPCNPEHRTDKDAKHRRGCREHRKEDITCNHPDFDRDIGAVEVQATDCPKRSRLSGYRRPVPSGPHFICTSMKSG